MHLAFTLLLLLTASLWLIFALLTIRAARRIPTLPPLPDTPPALPRVRVVIAARDEADRIAGSVRRLLRQQHVDLELVLVDDRSTDDTAARAREAADGDPRLRIIRVDALPDGWLGKCHALHLGSASLDRDWIAFLDADSWLAPDTLARAIAHARAEHAHHLCLIPGLGPTTLPGRAALTIFLMLFYITAHRVNRDAPRAYLGVGAFNLLSRTAHNAINPHQLLRLEVADDIYLGLAIRAHGGRARCALAIHELEVHWVRSARSLIRLLEKNQFAAIGYSLAKVALAITTLLTLWTLGHFAWLRADAPGIAATITMLCAMPAAHLVARRHNWGWTTAALAFTITPWLSMWALLHSTILTLKRRGVRWRDTTYPLSSLRSARKQLLKHLRNADPSTLSSPPAPDNAPPSHTPADLTHSPARCNHHSPTPVEPMLTPNRTHDGTR
ncbi:MAG: glycosyltransferase family 2 protein [Phycisphaerales bacterium]